MKKKAYNVSLSRGNCLEVMKKIPDKSVDMILCDLPYGTTANPWDNVIDWNLLWEQYLRIAKDNACIALFSQQPFTTKMVASNPKMFRYEWIWEKTKATGFLNANKMPMKKHENICIFYRKLPEFHPQMEVGKPYIKKGGKKIGSTNYRDNLIQTGIVNTGTRYPTDILRFASVSKEKGRKTHPTEKPVALLEYLIKTYTSEEQTVLDSCMGAGSTGVAAVNTDRKFIGIEMNREYYAIARQRIAQALMEARKRHAVADKKAADKTAEEQKTPATALAG